MKKIIIALLTLSLIFLTTCKNNSGKKTEKTPNIITKKVTAKGGLRMRNAPNTKGKIVGLIPEHGNVTQIKESGKELTIAKKTGKWTYVNFKGKKGWVFGGFLVASKMTNVPDPEIKLSAITGKSISLKLTPEEMADSIDFKLMANSVFTASCLLHGSGEAKIKGNYSQLPDGTVWRFTLKGVSNILHVSDKAKRYTKKFSSGSLVINKANGKLIATIKGLPGCEDFSDKELLY